VCDLFFRILEHFILNGSDPKALDCVMDQLNDPNRAHPQDGDKDSSGVCGPRNVM
jgi:hypothetical protein